MPKFLLGRRQFALGAAATALALPGKAVLGHDLLAQAAAGADQSADAQSLDKKARAAMAKLSPSAQAEVEMKVASIFRKYGDHLSDEQKADIRRIMAESQEGLEKMRAFKLENGDQPADAFRAYRHEEKRSEQKPRRQKPQEAAK